MGPAVEMTSVGWHPHGVQSWDYLLFAQGYVLGWRFGFGDKYTGTAEEQEKR